MIIFRVN